MDKQYIAIDLKSFFASVECVKRKLDPLNTNLVVADVSRTEKTICLAVTPSLKAYGISGRARLFEVIQKVREVNARRKALINGKAFRGKSCNANELAADPYLELDFITAKPCMADYVKTSAEIYSTYLKYVSEDDISVYSIDEVFMDVTSYLHARGKTSEEFAREIIMDVLSQTGITATAGIATNLYLCKIAMDIIAKKIQPDEYGVRIACLDEMSYRRLLWDHKPITDFWRIGHGTAQRLASRSMYTMGDIARKSLQNENVLYSLFGVNAELIIDHAWGWEPTEIKDIKSYCPENSSISSGQVLSTPYTFEKARICALEMADSLALELVSKRLVTNQLDIYVCYDSSNLSNFEIAGRYTGPVVADYYGKPVPKPSHKTLSLDRFTSSSREIVRIISEMFASTVNQVLLVRRVYVSFNNVIPEKLAKTLPVQLSLFDTDSNKQNKKENNLQKTVIELKEKFGKNIVLKAIDLEDGATAILRNSQIGGHKA